MAETLESTAQVDTRQAKATEGIESSVPRRSEALPGLESASAPGTRSTPVLAKILALGIACGIGLPLWSAWKQDEANLAKQRAEEAADQARESLRTSSNLADRRQAVHLWWDPAVRALARDLADAKSCIDLRRKMDAFKLTEADVVVGRANEFAGKLDSFLKTVNDRGQAREDAGWLIEQGYEPPAGWGEVQDDLNQAAEGADAVFGEAREALIQGSVSVGHVATQRFLDGLERARHGIVTGKRLFKLMGGDSKDLNDFGVLKVVAAGRQKR